MKALLLGLLLSATVLAADYPRDLTNNARWSEGVLEYAQTLPAARRALLEQLVRDAQAMGTLDPHKQYDALEGTRLRLNQVHSPISNYGAVTHRLFRGAQPSPAGLRWLQTRGIKTIIVLRQPQEGTNYPGWSREDYLREARGLGFTVVEMPIRDTGLPTPEQVQEFFQLVDGPGKLFYMHCSAGIGRTGVMAGLFLRHHGDPPSEALRHNYDYMQRAEEKPDHALQAAFTANYALTSIPPVPAATPQVVAEHLQSHQPLTLVESPDVRLVEALAEKRFVRFHFNPENFATLGPLSRAFPADRKLGRVQLEDVETARRWLGAGVPLEVVVPSGTAPEALGRRLQGKAQIVDFGQTPTLATAQVLARYGVAVEVHDDPGWTGLNYLKVAR